MSEVGDRVAARAHRKLPYRFHLVANLDLINAFALPGGHVFVGLGLLHQMTGEDELACVLGHEIEAMLRQVAALTSVRSRRLGTGAR